MVKKPVAKKEKKKSARQLQDELNKKNKLDTIQTVEIMSVYLMGMFTYSMERRKVKKNNVSLSL